MLNELIIIKEDKVANRNWAVCIIEEIFPGNDGIIV